VFPSPITKIAGPVKAEILKKSKGRLKKKLF